jgi:arabinofuranan 3-O-arabinosyltransferase
VALAAANLPTLWNGSYVDALLRRPSAIPAYWHQVADALSASDDGTRALELPGAEFAAYRWGTTTDPILPGLTDRPTLTRDLLPLGGAATMDLLDALDNRFQEGVVEPRSIAPVARLLGAGAIVYRGDTAFERYRTARPEPTWSLYDTGAPGLGAPVTYGPPAPNRSPVADVDETTLSDARIGQPVPPAAIVAVTDPVPIVRARDATHATVVEGSGDGIVDAAAAGLLDDPGIVLAPAAFAGDPDALRAAIPPGAPLVVTDTNRKRAEQWRGSQDTTGFTEDAGPGVLVADPADNRLPVFPGAGTDAQTLAEQRGGARAVASAYGEPNAYRPEDRADQAIDGDVGTAWRVGDRGDVIGQRLRVELPSARHIDHVTVVQPLDAAANRWITRLTVRTAAGATTVALTDESRTAAGQRIDVPAADTSWMELEVAGTNVGPTASDAGLDAVGLAQVRIDGVAATEELVRPPTDLLDALGAASADHPLTYVLTRERVDEHDRWRSDPEATIRRVVTVPTARTFTVNGTVHLTGRQGDAEFAVADVFQQAPAAVATSVLAGSLESYGRAAVDGDPATTWQTAFGGATGASVGINAGDTLTVDHLDLQIVTDAQHSVPTSLFVTAGGRTQPVTLPPLPERDGPVAVQVSFPPVTGSQFTVTIATIDARTTVDRRTGENVELPTAIAELGLPGYTAPPLPATFVTRCLDDRLTVDGTSVPFRLRGTTADALAGAPLAIEPCGDPITLAPGEHVIRTAADVTAIDRVVLGSSLAAAPVAPPADPVVRVTSADATHRHVEVTGAARPFWLVLGEGRNDGWHATVGGHDLGPSRTVDGGANGWLVTPAAGATTIQVALVWQPQRWVDLGLLLSAVAGAACIVLVAVGGRRRPSAAAGAAPAADPPELADPSVASGDRLAWPVAIAVAAAGALVAGLVFHPLAAPVVGAAIVVSARWRRGRVLLTGGAVGGLALAGVFTVARVVHSRPAPGFGWVTAFEPAHRLAFVAVLLAVADIVVEGARSRRTPTSAYDDPARHD